MGRTFLSIVKFLPFLQIAQAEGGDEPGIFLLFIFSLWRLRTFGYCVSQVKIELNFLLEGKQNRLIGTRASNSENFSGSDPRKKIPDPSLQQISPAVTFDRIFDSSTETNVYNPYWPNPRL